MTAPVARLAAIDVEIAALLSELAGETGHRSIMARAQIEAAKDALAKARGFLLAASSSTGFRPVKP